jgi:hypothetical protein
MRALLVLTLLVIGCQRSPAPSATPDEASSRDSAAAVASASSGEARAVPDASAPDAGVSPDAGSPSTYGPRTIPLSTQDGVVRLGKGSDFPAANHEGTEIVLLAHDHVDFAGTAVEHILFLDARTGRRSADVTVYDEMSERDKSAAQLAGLRRTYTANLAEASKRLATTTWRALESPSLDDAAGPWTSLAAARADAGQSLSVRFGPDLDLELPVNTGSETVAPLTVRRLRGTSIATTTARIRIPRLASQGGMTAPLANGPCGWVQRVGGWADPQRRFVLLALEPAVPGDACTVPFDSDTMVLVPLSP